MTVDLFDLYKNPVQSKRFVWSAIMSAIKAVGMNMNDLSHEVVSDTYPVEVVMLVNGKECPLYEFFETLVTNIDHTLESGAQDFVEKKAGPLLATIANLSEKLKEDIAAIAPEYDSEY